MEIVIIGTGNVASVLGRKLKAAGHHIAQVFGRTPIVANELAQVLEAPFCSSWSQLNKDADFYLVAVSDDVLQTLSDFIDLDNKLVAHTAGAVPIKVLKSISGNYGLFYPLQSLRKDVKDLPTIPIIVEGNNAKSLERLTAIAQTISPMVTELNDEQRLHLHLAAVLVNNFTNHLYALAEDYCIQHNLNFKKLHPLLQETANRIQQYSPAEVQTGPAIRNDTTTLQKHIDLLKDNEPLQHIYEVLSKSIRHFHKV